VGKLKVGDWVVFWTKNWPKDVQTIKFTLDDSASGRNVTGEGLYSGRGKIVRVSSKSWVVQEERSDLLVEVDYSERIELMDRGDYSPLTLGDLRQFIEKHKAAPDNTPIIISLPVGFTCDDEFPHDLPEDHPEAHMPDVFHTVFASHLVFTSVEEMADLAGQFEDAGEDMHAGPQIEIIIHPREAHAAMRNCNDEDESTAV
jgi:hypothetical protein